MKKEQFEQAKPLIKNIENIEKLIKRFDWGWDKNKTEEFKPENDDFYGAYFFNILNKSTSKSTGGGSIDLQRVDIAEFKDGSGGRYRLTKSETIALQDFIQNLLQKRLTESINKLKSI